MKKVLVLVCVLSLMSFACGGGGGGSDPGAGTGGDDDIVAPSENVAKPSMTDGCDDPPYLLQYADMSLYLGDYAKVEEDNVTDTCSGWFGLDFADTGTVLNINDNELVVQSAEHIYIFEPNTLYTRGKCSYKYIRYLSSNSIWPHCVASTVTAVVDGETRDLVGVSCFTEDLDSCSVGYRRKADYQF